MIVSLSIILYNRVLYDEDCMTTHVWLFDLDKKMGC